MRLGSLNEKISWVRFLFFDLRLSQSSFLWSEKLQDELGIKNVPHNFPKVKLLQTKFKAQLAALIEQVDFLTRFIGS